MARPKQSTVIPPLTNWGGVRSVQRRLERSSTIVANKEAVAYALLSMANTKLTDIMSWDDQGNVKVKASHEIPEHALHAIKNIRVQTRKDKDGDTYSTLEIELYDKVGVLRLLAKASGLLDNPDDDNKPSVIDINVVAPRGNDG
jgi:23S rRNA G2069 N7-methylase RlmK/C1962 C5-methylase RlmI